MALVVGTMTDKIPVVKCTYRNFYGRRMTDVCPYCGHVSVLPALTECLVCGVLEATENVKNLAQLLREHATKSVQDIEELIKKDDGDRR